MKLIKKNRLNWGSKTHLGSFDQNDPNDSLVFQYNIYLGEIPGFRHFVWARQPAHANCVISILPRVTKSRLKKLGSPGTAKVYIRDRLIEFSKKYIFLPFRVSGTLKPVEYAGKNRFSKYWRFHVLNRWSLIMATFHGPYYAFVTQTLCMQ